MLYLMAILSMSAMQLDQAHGNNFYLRFIIHTNKSWTENRHRSWAQRKVFKPLDGAFRCLCWPIRELAESIILKTHPSEINFAISLRSITICKITMHMGTFAIFLQRNLEQFLSTLVCQVFKHCVFYGFWSSLSGKFFFLWIFIVFQIVFSRRKVQDIAAAIVKAMKALTIIMILFVVFIVLFGLMIYTLFRQDFSFFILIQFSKWFRICAIA